MSKVWEFFENMNEAVYASDVDTYELLYLNKAARDLFQFKDESEYKGKNCYEILQQCSSPCAMCTNNRLKPGVFYEWSRFNPLVRRSYLLKDTMVIDDVRRVRIEMAIDLDIHELAKRSFSEFTDNEALINEGLRCALAEETPEQSIDTLLQYLGQMFQSDRVYIFEKNKHGNFDNTYEWCADGIIPEIDELQNVNMDIIDWWYEAFSKGESIIITDVEEIREEHCISYNMLKAQNVKNVVVCPLYYKDEIKGFFGVDNPPKSDYRGLTTFLDMVGTLLVSFLKLRNSFIKSNNMAKLRSYSSLSKIYEAMHYINVQTGRYHVVKTTVQFTRNLEKYVGNMGEYEIRDDFYGHIKHFTEKVCIESQLEEALEFIDIRTLEERLQGKISITHEFKDKRIGWCRSRFIPVDYDENGSLLHVLYCIESIDEEKKRENRLLYLAQTDLMTGICNRGSGECRISAYLKERKAGLLCLIDCDKFKSINDTYGHAVGDKVLIAIAETLQKVCRDKDVIFRLGGDEFAIFMPGMMEQKAAENFFERLFENIRQIDIEEMQGKSIEISMGACFYEGTEEVSFDELYKNADSVMYQSKEKQGCSAMIYGLYTDKKDS